VSKKIPRSFENVRWGKRGARPRGKKAGKSDQIFWNWVRSPLSKRKRSKGVKAREVRSGPEQAGGATNKSRESWGDFGSKETKRLRRYWFGTKMGKKRTLPTEKLARKKEKESKKTSIRKCEG